MMTGKSLEEDHHFDGKDKLTGFVRCVKFWLGLSFLDFLPLKCDACSKLFW